MPVPPSEPDPRVRRRPSTLSPVQRARLEEYLEALEERAAERRETLRADHPELATEFDAVEGAFRRLSSRLELRRQAADELGSVADSVDPGISLDRGPGGAGSGREAPADADLLRRIAGRSVPPERYRARREIARGGMGSIQRVWDEDLRRYLVMKVMLRPQDRDPHAQSVPPDARQLTRFLEEAQITGQLDHPGILPVHDLGLDEEGRLYFTMPLVVGQDLAQVIEKARRGVDGWNTNRVLNVLVRVMEAIAFAHDRGVLHRDLKPENIMVGRFGETYVMDWGLARVLDRLAEEERRPAPSMAANLRRRVRRSGLGRVLRGKDERAALASRGSVETLDGDMVGTPGYMAPEQARGERDAVGPRSDIYALGAVIYQLLTGYRPFDDPLSRERDEPLLERILHGRPVPVKELDRDQPDELVAICEKAMAEDPSDRYESVLDLTEDVRAYVEGHVVRAYETGLWAESRKWVQRNRVLASVSAAAALLAVGAAVALIVQQRRSLADLEVEQQRTREALVEAEEQRDQARFQETLARDAKRALEEVNTALELGRDIANQKAAEAAAAERVAKRRAYVGNVTAASIALRANELGEARRLLDACPPELRRWEWDHLRAQLEVSLSSVELEGREPRALAVLDDERAAVLDAERGVTILGLDGGEVLARWPLAAGEARELVHDPARDHLWLSAGPAPLVRLDLEDLDDGFSIGPEFGTDARRVEWGPLALSPDGNRLAAGVTRAGLAAADLVVSIFDTRTGAVVRELASPAMRAVSELEWSPDGRRLAIGFEDGSLQLRDLEGDTATRTTRPFSDAIVALDFGADSQRLAVAGGGQEAVLLDVETGGVLRSIRGHTDALTDLAFAAFDEFLVTASADRSLILWDPDTGEELGSLRGHEGTLVATGTTPDADRVVSLAADRTLRSWDPRSPDAVTGLELREPRGSRWFAFSEDGRRWAAPSGFDGEIHDLTTLETVGTLDTDGFLFTDVARWPGRDAFVTVQDSGVIAFDDSVGAVERRLFEVPRIPTQLALSSDGGALAIATLETSVRAAVRPDEPPPRLSLTLTEAPVTVLCWRLDDDTLSGRPSGPWPFGAHAAQALPRGVREPHLALDHRGRRAWVAASDGTLRELDLLDGSREAPVRLRASLERQVEGAVALLLGTQLRVTTAVLGRDRRFGLPRALAPILPATALEVAPGDDLVAVGFLDGRIELWPTSEDAAPTILRSNRAAIRDLTFDQRGERLVSGAADGSLRVFDLEVGEQLLPLYGHPSAVAAVAFSPTGRDLFSTDDAGNVRVWSTASLRQRFVARREADRLRRAARNYLIGTLEGFVSASELMSRLDEDQSVDAELRERVRIYLRAFGENAGRLNGDAWAVVQSDDRTAEDYRDAYLWALFAHTLEPDEPLYERTLGIAFHRLGRHAQAIEALERSSREHRRGPRAEELAVLALCHAALGDLERARSRQAEFDALMRGGFWARDPVARAFEREVRAELGPPDARLPAGDG